MVSSATLGDPSTLCCELHSNPLKTMYTIKNKTTQQIFPQHLLYATPDARPGRHSIYMAPTLTGLRAYRGRQTQISCDSSQNIAVVK